VATGTSIMVAVAARINVQHLFQALNAICPWVSSVLCILRFNVGALPGLPSTSITESEFEATSSLNNKIPI